MYCKYCGNEVAEGAKFCRKCGNAISMSEISTDENTPSFSEQQINNRKMLIAIFAVLVLVMAGVWLYKVTSGPSQKTLLMLINQSNDLSLNLNEMNIPVTLQDVKIDSKSKQKDGQYNVICDTVVSNGQIEANVQYCFIMGKQNGEWMIENQKLVQIMDIRPLQGVSEPAADEMSQLIKSLYPQIDWKYEYYDLVLEPFDYNFPISWNLEKQETDLNERIDSLLYSYEIETFSGTISGQVQIDYNFVNGQWEQNEAFIKKSNFEWNLVGWWEFDIFTYYVSIYFEDVDLETGIATLLCKGGYIHGDENSGFYREYRIPFEERDDCIYFDPFNVQDTYGNDTTEIKLMATVENLKYSHPSMFANMDDFWAGAGKKGEAEYVQYDETTEAVTIKQGDRVEGTIEKSSSDNNDFVLVFDRPVNIECWNSQTQSTYTIKDVREISVYASLIASLGTMDLTPYISKRISCALYVSDDNTTELEGEMVWLELAEGEVKWQLSEPEVESEVLRIRKVWTEDQNAANAGEFHVYTDAKGIKYYSEDEHTKLVIVPKGVFGDYNITFQIEDGEITFAYYVNNKEQNRLYFKYMTLFRWNETTADKHAVMHDNEFENQQFIDWESQALTDFVQLDVNS